MITVAAALDVGGTKIAGGVVTADGTLLHSTVRSCLSDGRRDPGLAITLAIARGVLAWAADEDLEVAGLGAGFPEYVDAHGQLTSREVIEWTQQPLDLLAPLVTGRACAIDSDVRCGALAEALLGAGRTLSDFVYVSLGTGLSSTVVRAGAPIAGRRGEALALGELEVPASVDPSWGGNLESYCSGSGLSVRYSQRTGVELDGAREVLSLAVDRDDNAREIVDSGGRALGATLAALAAVLDPEAFVIGGGLGASSGPLDEAIRDEYGARTTRRVGAPPLLRAQLGAGAGLTGAALLVLEDRAGHSGRELV